MIAIDTNVIVRYLVADQSEQFRRATALIEAEQVFVPSTVALEAEWVLRAIYRLNRAAILGALRKFAALPTVAFENMGILTQALDWAEQGMDFADALHLASAAGCVAFASFDRGLKQTAAKLRAPAVRAP
jgi:predicted nucleic-acid-binding protein